jgi:hypothetical protein
MAISIADDFGHFPLIWSLRLERFSLLLLFFFFFQLALTKSILDHEEIKRRGKDENNKEAKS